MLPSGEYTSRIDIETPTATNTNGEVTEAWASTEKGVPARVTPRESLTFTQAAQVQQKTTHVVTVRYRDDLTSLSRFKIGSRTFNIQGMPRRMPEARPTELVFEVVEVE
jgi:SPP1 family predicted phage head-tail adaptor